MIRLKFHRIVSGLARSGENGEITLLSRIIGALSPRLPLGAAAWSLIEMTEDHRSQIMCSRSLEPSEAGAEAVHGSDSTRTNLSVAWLKSSKTL